VNVGRRADESGEEAGQAFDAADRSERAAVPDDAGGDVLVREFRLVLVEDAVAGSAPSR
jgi:hypothetical protein